MIFATFDRKNSLRIDFKVSKPLESPSLKARGLHVLVTEVRSAGQLPFGRTARLAIVQAALVSAWAQYPHKTHRN
jgi:hypothetical protein